MTNLCRTPNGTMVLRPIQAITLLEATEVGGVLANVRTGGGKTITSGLLPYVLRAERPLLFVPANLRAKTQREFQTLRQHWRIPKNLRIESYEKLGQSQHESMLIDYRPDVVIGDEAHALKRVMDSARARRVARFAKYFPETKFCWMTGTLGDVDEFAHLLIWSLGEGAPVPLEPDEIAIWAKILNVNVRDEERADPEILVPHLGPEALDYPRTAFRERLSQTPGVIISVDTFDGCNLVVRPRYVEPPENVDAAFADLRQTLTLPDGWMLADAALEGWAAARKLGCGLYSIHDPRPPQPFRDIRKQYCRLVRGIIENSERYDTELQVRVALANGELWSPPYYPSTEPWPLPDSTLLHAQSEKIALVRNSEAGDLLGIPLFEAWQRIEPTYSPEITPCWISDHVVNDAIAWGRGTAAQGGIIWVDTIALAERIAERTGWPYFHNMGRDERGRFIEDKSVAGRETIIASVDSNKQGRNLQHKWHRNLIVEPMNSGEEWEQLVSRTHRDGQVRDTVFVDYVVSCYEFYNSIYKAHNDNQAEHQTVGQNFRLLNGDVLMPSLVGRKGRWAWQRSDKKNKVEI